MMIESCRRGVGKVLFAQVKSFCEQHGFDRIVLTTTNLQADACDRLYPGLGFRLVGPKVQLSLSR
eukprot:COSAG02_NODE_1339_length_13187_cov_610.871027_11_plen_65_part_00